MVTIQDNNEDTSMNYYTNTENVTSQSQKWLQQISPFNTHKMDLNPTRSALLVVDMLNFFLDPVHPASPVAAWQSCPI